MGAQVFSLRGFGKFPRRSDIRLSPVYEWGLSREGILGRKSRSQEAKREEKAGC